MITLKQVEHLLQNYSTRDQLESLLELGEFNLCDEMRQGRMQWILGNEQVLEQW